MESTDIFDRMNGLAQQLPVSANFSTLQERIAAHKARLQSVPRERPDPARRYRIGVYIRCFNQTRHCGDVLTRKTYTSNYRDHLAKKNRGQRPRSWYKDYHEAIVTRDDFAAAQKILDNARYGARQVLPVLCVIKKGSLRGFAVIHPHWAGI